MSAGMMRQSGRDWISSSDCPSANAVLNTVSVGQVKIPARAVSPAIRCTFVSSIQSRLYQFFGRNSPRSDTDAFIGALSASTDSR